MGVVHDWAILNWLAAQRKTVAGFTTKEIADRTNLSWTTVHKRLLKFEGEGKVFHVRHGRVDCWYPGNGYAFELQRIVEVLRDMNIFSWQAHSEKELHELVYAKLKDYGFTVSSEFPMGHDRFDFVCNGVIIELKRLASSQICEQLDEYSRTAKALIVVCLKATEPFKEIFQKAKLTIPCALVELKHQRNMV